MDKQQRPPLSKKSRLSREESDKASKVVFDEIFGSVYEEKPKAVSKTERKLVTTESRLRKTESKTVVSRLPKEPHEMGKPLKKDEVRRTNDKHNASHQETDNERRRATMTAQASKKTLDPSHKRISLPLVKDDKSLVDHDKKALRKAEGEKLSYKVSDRKYYQTNAPKRDDLTKNNQPIELLQNLFITKKKEVSDNTLNSGKSLKSLESKDGVKITSVKAPISREDLPVRNNTIKKSIKPDATRIKSESSHMKPVNNSTRRPEQGYKQTMPTAVSWDIFNEIFDGSPAQSSSSVRKNSNPAQLVRPISSNQQSRSNKFPEISRVQTKPREYPSAEINNQSRINSKPRIEDIGHRNEDRYGRQMAQKVASRSVLVNNKKRDARDISPESSRTSKQEDPRPPAKKRLFNSGVASSSLDVQNRKRLVRDLSPGPSRVSKHRQSAGRNVTHRDIEAMDERQIRANVSSIIQSIFPRREVSQAISTRLAKQEDEEQERIDQQRRLLKAKRAKKLTH
ncbi:16810_t:CDS:2 [Acaulospora morrowiae]|uniref:16810_t:CDS:1 n=1 Tax=Acaulospora morrowiae TaxID=94023 RepID=A0A9N8V591_9GLOM|nr:16810_t:CDS:2 [Acaulospora morrowiae]